MNPFFIYEFLRLEIRTIANKIIVADTTIKKFMSKIDVFWGVS